MSMHSCSYPLQQAEEHLARGAEALMLRLRKDGFACPGAVARGLPPPDTDTSGRQLNGPDGSETGAA